jgi:hypothetical protein
MGVSWIILAWALADTQYFFKMQNIFKINSSMQRLSGLVEMV